MTRARTAAAASLSLVVGGMVAAMAARSATTTEPRANLLPPEAAILPANAGFVAGLDVTRLFASAWYQKQLKNPAYAPPPELRDLERRAGVSLEKDVRQILVAGEAREKDSAVLLVLGTFERKRLEGALGEARDLTSRDYKGRKLWIPPAAKNASPTAAKAPEFAFTVLSEGVILAGPTTSVTAALDRQTVKTPGLLGNEKMLALVQQVRPGSVFWACGDETVLSAAANVTPSAGGFNLPTLRSLVASGDVAPDLAVQIVAEAADADAAKALAGMLQAVTGLMAMQAGDKPELKELMAGLDVVHEGTQVRLNARVRYETLDKLAAQATAAAAARAVATATAVTTVPPRPQREAK